MAVTSNKNILTNTSTAQSIPQVPTQVTNNPVQNQNLAVPTAQQVPVVQVPIQVQPVQAPVTTNNIQQQTQPIQNNIPQQVNQPQANNVAQQQVSAPVNYNNQNSQIQNKPITTTNTKTGQTSTWTPIRITNTDITTSEGQYQSAYASTLNDVVNSILTARFSYNPEEDDLLQLATQYSTQSTFESMNARGILNSSMTGERVAKVISDLTYQYQQLAREDFEREFNRMLSIANLVMTMDNNAYNQWVDNRNYQYQLKQDEYQKQQDKITRAWERVDQIGYVDNDASMILGLPVGTLSKEARQRIEAKQDEIELYEKKLAMQQKSDMEMYQLKAGIDAMYELDMTEKKQQMELDTYRQKSQIDMSDYEKKANFQQEKDIETYEIKSIIDARNSNTSSSSSKNNEVTQYENIIQNSFVTKNDYGQYVVNNLKNFMDYVKSENQLGKMSDDTALYLIQKYTNNSNNYSSNQMTQYDNIIKNQYASKNDKGQYEIEDKNKMAVMQFLSSEQSQGRLTTNTVTSLLQKYGLYGINRDEIKRLMKLEDKK